MSFIRPIGALITLRSAATSIAVLSLLLLAGPATAYDPCEHAPSLPQCQESGTPNTAPTTPLSVSASVTSSTSIALKWSKSTDDKAVTEYKLYRNGSLVTSFGDTDSYTDTGLSAGTSYSYTLAACDAANACSPQSSSVTAAIPAATTPLSASAVSSGEITAQQIHFSVMPGGSDLGKNGTIFVAFIYQGSVFFMDSQGAWSAYVAGKAPNSYYTGPLTSLGNTALLKGVTDLTSLKGGQLIVGYGVGTAPLQSPFDEMLAQTRYSVVLTVK